GRRLGRGQFADRPLEPVVRCHGQCLPPSQAVTPPRAIGSEPSMGILSGKRVLITGVLTDDSLAFGVARLAQEQGAEIVLTGAGRGMGLTQRMARRLPSEPEVLELDVTNPEHVDSVRTHLTEKWGSIDGALHAIGFAPPSCLGGGFMDAPWDDVSVAFHISTYSLKVLADVVVPLMANAGGGSIVGLDFDNSVMAFP